MLWTLDFDSITLVTSLLVVSTSSSMSLRPDIVGVAVLAGMSEAALTHPLDTLRTHKQVYGTSVRTGLRTLGAARLYAGLPVTMAGLVPLFALRFAIAQQGQGQQHQKPLAVLMTGAGVGMAEGAVATVFEAEKVARQARKVDLAKARHTGLWRGLSATTLRGGITGATVFTVYSQTASRIAERLERDQLSGFQRLCSGVAAACAGVVVAAPVDMVKTLQQSCAVDATGGIVPTLKQVAGSRGLRHAMFAGAGTRCVQVAVGSTLTLMISDWLALRLARDRYTDLPP